MKTQNIVIALFLVSVINVCAAKSQTQVFPPKNIAAAKVVAPQKQVGKVTYNRLHLKPLQASDFKFHKF